jgi:hypothetical protein
MKMKWAVDGPMLSPGGGSQTWTTRGKTSTRWMMVNR